MYQKFILSLKGFCMGAADIVPGVSGGTMAFILGIYTQLLAAIRSFDAVCLQQTLKFQLKSALQRPHWSFIFPLLLGLLAAVIFFTKVIPLHELLHTHPELIYGLFFGLIAGSIITLLPEGKPFDSTAGLLLILGTVVGLLVVNLVPLDTPEAAWFIFLSGMIAISAMLLPGISGSFILLILNKYDVVLNGISRLDLWIIIPFLLGVGVGLIIFSRLLGWLLARFYRIALLIIVGVLIGSLWRIWPFQIREYVTVREKERLIATTPYFPETVNETVIYSVGMMFIGLVLVLVIHRLASRTH